MTIFSADQYGDVVSTQPPAATTVKDWGHFNFEVSFPTAPEEVEDLTQGLL